MKSKDPAISILLPVFNTERHLRQCLDSILAQTFSDFELICVDDGSTDQSLTILQTYAQRDKRVLVLHQENKGLSLARNYGMQFVKGKYQIHLDADDFFDPRLLETSYREAERHSAQIVLFGFYKYDDKTGRKIGRWNEKRTYLTSAEKIGRDLFVRYEPNTWLRLLLTSFVVESGIRFQPIAAWTDVYFSRMLMLLADRIVICKDKLVYYRVNNVCSIQGSPRKPLICAALAYKELKREMKRRGLFRGGFKEGYYVRAQNALVGNLLGGKSDWANRTQLYRFMREESVPDIFDSRPEVTDERFKRVFKHEFLGDYLLDSLKKSGESAFSSLDYRLGRAILRLPRLVRNVLRKVCGKTR